MNKITEIIGIDVSHLTFDVWSSTNGHATFENNQKGFKSLLKTLSSDSHCVMEATGCYYQQLAKHLFTHGIKVTVLNPVVGKRFIQMNLQHNKSDKIDAKMLCLYGERHSLEEWQPEAEEFETCKLISGALSLYFKQQTSLKNKLHSLKSRGMDKGGLVRSIKRQLKHVKAEIEYLEEELENLVKHVDQEQLTNLRSIPGIGKKAAVILIVFSGGLHRFENAKQLSAYFGLAPTERTSGTSVRGRSRISKRGNPHVRTQLFLSSFSACIHNAQCKALYDRIVDKGKSKKLALIAVSNKLLSQVLAISKSGIPYDAQYKSKLTIT